MFTDGEQVMTLQFIAKRPQEEWQSAAIWTGPKYVGDENAKDLNITPAMGVVEVRRIQNPVDLKDLEKLLVFPNPNQGTIALQFQVAQDGPVFLGVNDLIGRQIQSIINQNMPQGKYIYKTDLSRLDNGFYMVTLQTISGTQTEKIIIQK